MNAIDPHPPLRPLKFFPSAGRVAATARRIGFVLFGCVCVAGRAAAEPVSVDLVPVDNSAGGAELTGYATTDIVLTIPTLHSGSQLIIELDQGTIFQHALGSNLVPNGGVVSMIPAVAYDTFVAYGAATGLPFGDYAIWGAAVNLDMDPLPRPATFNESRADVTWGPTAGGNLPENTDDFLAARITLSDDATGRWIYLASSLEEYTVVAPAGHPIHAPGIPLVSAGHGVIRSGQLLVIPEPTTLGLLLAVGALWAGCRACRRQKPSVL